MNSKAKKLIEDFYVDETRIIEKLKEKNAQNSKKSMGGCIRKILNKNFKTHQILKEEQDIDTVRFLKVLTVFLFKNQENFFISHSLSLSLYLFLSLSTHHSLRTNRNLFPLQITNTSCYLDAGVYNMFGNSCHEAFLISQKKPKKAETKIEDLKSSSWYQSGLRSEFSLELLEHQSTGSFLVHKNASKSKSHILSLRVPNGDAKVGHYLIQHCQKGYRIKGSSKFFSTITSLVTHHSVMPENLPVTLSLPRPQNVVSKCKNEDDYDNFSTLENLTTIFTDLEL